MNPACRMTASVRQECSPCSRDMLPTPPEKGQSRVLEPRLADSLEYDPAGSGASVRVDAQLACAPCVLQEQLTLIMGLVKQHVQHLESADDRVVVDARHRLARAVTSAHVPSRLRAVATPGEEMLLQGHGPVC